MRWAVYYDDGTRLTDGECEVWDLPGLGVQVVAQADPEVGRVLLSGDDYFWFEDGTWRSGDLFGLWDYLFARPGRKKALAGRLMPTEEHQAVYHRAKDDDYLPEKTARSSHREGRPRGTPPWAVE